MPARNTVILLVPLFCLVVAVFFAWDSPLRPSAPAPHPAQSPRTVLPGPAPTAKGQPLLLEGTAPRRHSTRTGVHLSTPPWTLAEPTAATDPHTIHQRHARLSPNFFDDLLGSRASSFGLSLAPGRVIRATEPRFLSRGPDTRTLIARTPGSPVPNVLLVLHHGVVHGSITLYETGEFFEIGSTSSGESILRQLDPASFAEPCDCGQIHADPAAPFDLSQATFSTPLNATAQPIVIDTVVGYGSQARIDAGGTAQIEALIIAAIDRSNVAFDNSGIGQIEVNLRATLEDPDYIFPGSRANSMGSNDELGDLNHPVDGNLDAITDLQTALGADHAAFVVTDAQGGTAGIAYKVGASMVVSRTYMNAVTHVFAHELGHNIGAGHSWGDSSGDLDAYSYYGWRIQTPNLGKRRTIMAYDSGWIRIPHFSNPAVTFDGIPTGVPAGYDATSDSNADPRYVSGGYIETAGTGFDGSDPNLGADCATFLAGAASHLAGFASRPDPVFEVTVESGQPLLSGAAEVAFRTTSITATDTRAFTLRNVGSATLENITLSLGAPVSFSMIAGPGPSLAPGAETSFVIGFAPTAGADETVSLTLSSTTPDAPDFTTTLVGDYDPPAPALVVSHPSDTTLVPGESQLWLPTSGSSPVTRTLHLMNAGELDLADLAFTLSGDDASDFSLALPADSILTPGASALLAVTFTPGASAVSTTTLHIASNDPEHPDFEIPIIGSTDGTFSCESFEGDLGVWSHGGDTPNWELRTGSTPTFGTGPSGAHDGDQYLFTESTGNPYHNFEIESSFDFSHLATAEIAFHYHMYGSAIGQLHVEIFDEETWLILWTRDGQQHAADTDPWSEGVVDLAAYAGSPQVRLRIRGVTANLSRGDIGLDAVSLRGTPETHTLTYTTVPGGSLAGSTSQTVEHAADATAVTAVAEEGHTFASWSDGVFDNPRTDLAVSSDLAVTALFLADTAPGFATWAAAADLPEGLDGPEDSALGDGIPNIFKYAFNLDPTSYGAHRISPDSGTSGLPHTALTNGVLTVVYLRSTSSPDLAYEVSFSSNLDEASWQSIGVETSVVAIDDDWERVTVTDSDTTSPARFARVAVASMLTVSSPTPDD